MQQKEGTCVLGTEQLHKGSYFIACNKKTLLCELFSDSSLHEHLMFRMVNFIFIHMAVCGLKMSCRITFGSHVQFISVISQTYQTSRSNSCIVLTNSITLSIGSAL